MNERSISVIEFYEILERLFPAGSQYYQLDGKKVSCIDTHEEFIKKLFCSRAKLRGFRVVTQDYAYYICRSFDRRGKVRAIHVADFKSVMIDTNYVFSPW
jgi:hypothetical protein